MPIETVTIINNSGKIITNGKHLFGLFKEAKASYQEKKAAVKAERAVKRSQTYDVACQPEYYDEVEYLSAGGRRLSYDDGDGASHASSRRSHRSRHSRAPTERSRGGALTESNLKTHSEVSSVTPSRAPTGMQRRSPYGETVDPYDMAVSRPNLARTRTMPLEVIESQSFYDSQPPMQQLARRSTAGIDPAKVAKENKKIDLNLAYGSIPPDLAERVDLDPAYMAAQKERKAQDLAHKIEGLLTEAHCLHHTATHMITHLQANPEAAAAVALSLAELSALLGKMSPAFLGAIKAGSPAVFALLASPQFLIAAGLTVGVTVVMFGGWKIVKRIADAHTEMSTGAGAPHAVPMAFEAYPASSAGSRTVRPDYPATERSASVFDEALVLEEELSSIETWRRGISQCGVPDDASSVDLELITPNAMQSQYGDDDDARTVRTMRTSKTSKTHRTDKTEKSHRSSRHSEAPVEYRKSSSRTVRDGDSVAGSERSHRSNHSSKSKRTVKTIEDGSRDRENSFEAVVRPKKDNMLKNMFKRKIGKDERSSRMESVLA
ncbi:uncharacterized protein PG998_005322 [Apiospora kogelbergensis]|uniref:uncharacterized protein n=1 Tax=Apiospora kogelbergensis TaxID=1337665 RepID=UPI00312FD0DC